MLSEQPWLPHAPIFHSSQSPPPPPPEPQLQQKLRQRPPLLPPSPPWENPGDPDSLEFSVDSGPGCFYSSASPESAGLPHTGVLTHISMATTPQCAQCRTGGRRRLRGGGRAPCPMERQMVGPHPPPSTPTSLCLSPPSLSHTLHFVWQQLKAGFQIHCLMWCTAHSNRSDP